MTLWSIYYYFWQGFYNFGSFINALAGISAVMIAISFAFGTFTFYTDFLDTKLAYRKYFGLVGYWYAMLHVSLLAALHPQENFVNPVLKGIITQDQQLGAIAMLILTFMTVISHEKVPVLISPKLWRNSLRLGYLIYIVFIPRAILLDGPLWSAWFEGVSESLLLPPSLIASILGILVIVFRLSAPPIKFFKKSLIRVKTTPPVKVTSSAEVHTKGL